MKRKVNRVGVNTLTVSLPSKWVKKLKISPGDELFCQEDRSRIIISKTGIMKDKKDISLRIDHFNKYVLSRYLTVLYRMGYSKITLVYSKATLRDLKSRKDVNIKKLIKKLCDRFIGMDITSQTSTKTDITCFLSSNKEHLRTIEKRIFFLLKETIDELLKTAKKDHKTFHESVYDHHDNIVKYINYYLRMVELSDMNEYEKHHLTTLYQVVDMIVDKIRHLSEKIDKYGCTVRVEKYIQTLFNFFFEALEGLHRTKLPDDYVTKRYKIVQSLQNEKFSLAEYQVIAEIIILLDLNNYFYEAVVVNQLSK